jgi:hypothetical protein
MRGWHWEGAALYFHQKHNASEDEQAGWRTHLLDFPTGFNTSYYKSSEEMIDDHLGLVVLKKTYTSTKSEFCAVSYMPTLFPIDPAEFVWLQKT